MSEVESEEYENSEYDDEYDGDSDNVIEEEQNPNLLQTAIDTVGNLLQSAQKDDDSDEETYDGTATDIAEEEEPAIPKIEEFLNEDDVEFLTQALERLGRWEDVKHSGLWVSFLGLCYFLTEVSHYPLVTVLSYMVMFQVFAVNMLIRNEEVIKRAGIWREEFDPRWIANHRQALSHEEINRTTRGLAMVGQNWARRWEEVLDTDDDARLLSVISFLAGLTLVGKFLPLSGAMFLVGMYIFLFPVVYAKYQDDIDQVYESTQERLKGLMNIATQSLESNGSF